MDGYMAGKAGQEMDFVTSKFLPEMEEDIALAYQHVDRFLFGKTTYESLAQYWPTVSQEEEPLADIMNKMHKVVFSSTLGQLEWNNAHLAVKGLEQEVRSLKEKEGKDIMIIGSASLVQQLTGLGLIDEYRFLLFPVLLGGGKPLFKAQEKAINLHLTKSKAYTNGTLLLSYTRE